MAPLRRSPALDGVVKISPKAAYEMVAKSAWLRERGKLAQCEQNILVDALETIQFKQIKSCFALKNLIEFDGTGIVVTVAVSPSYRATEMTMDAFSATIIAHELRHLYQHLISKPGLLFEEARMKRKPSPNLFSKLNYYVRLFHFKAFICIPFEYDAHRYGSRAVGAMLIAAMCLFVFVLCIAHNLFYGQPFGRDLSGAVVIFAIILGLYCDLKWRRVPLKP